MLAKRIVTLTLNPALDISSQTERVVPQHKLRCLPPRRDPGGGGINAARVIRRLGGDVACVFPAGGIAGTLLQRLLEGEGLHAMAISTAAETREDFTVLDCASGQQYRFVMPGAALAPGELQACLAAVEAAPADIVVASGSLPQGTDAASYALLARRVQAQGRKLVVDTSGAALKAALSQGVWMIKPNLRELRELSGLPLDGEADMLAAARGIVEGGGAEIVALTLAERGARLVTRDGVWTAAAPQIAPRSTVGAGDSFVGGLIWALARDLPLEEALRHGVAAGTAALMSQGTELAHAENVFALLPQIRAGRA